MVGQELPVIPGWYSILLCNIWPEKGHLLLWGFPVGRSMLDRDRQRCHGGAVGQPWPCTQQSLVEHQPSPFALPCLPSSIAESKAHLAL